MDIGYQKRQRRNLLTPTEGLVRIDQLAAFGVPWARSTIWQKVREGEFPAPLKLGALAVWPVREVRAAVAGLEAKARATRSAA